MSTATVTDDLSGSARGDHPPLELVETAADLAEHHVPGDETDM